MDVLFCYSSFSPKTSSRYIITANAAPLNLLMTAEACQNPVLFQVATHHRWATRLLAIWTTNGSKITCPHTIGLVLLRVNLYEKFLNIITFVVSYFRSRYAAALLNSNQLLSDMCKSDAQILLFLQTANNWEFWATFAFCGGLRQKQNYFYWILQMANLARKYFRKYDTNKDGFLELGAQSVHQLEQLVLLKIVSGQRRLDPCARICIPASHLQIHCQVYPS